MSHEPSRYFQDLDDDGKSGIRTPVTGGCPGPAQCSERVGGAVLIGYGLVAIIVGTLCLIAGCQIGFAKGKAAARAEVAP